MTILGYEILPNDLNCFLIENPEKRPEQYKYLNVYSDVEISKNIHIKERKIDIGFSYDGFCIVSKRFKDFCLENEFDNLFFQPIDLIDPFFIFKTENILNYDSIRGGIRFLNFNPKYNGYFEIIGPHPIILENDQPVPENVIFRSDLFFGTGISKAPLLMIGCETFRKFEKEKFKGIYFSKITTKSNANMPSG